MSPTFEPEPYRVVEKNGNAVIIENSTGQRKMRIVGHMKTERGATSTESPAPPIPAVTPKEGVTYEKIKSDTRWKSAKRLNTSCTSSTQSSSRKAGWSSSQEMRDSSADEGLCLPIETELLGLIIM